MRDDDDIIPEPGEVFAVAGEVIIKLKGVAHARREGNLVVTDRRIAFKGRLTLDSWVSIARRAAGRGSMDLSIPYENLREVRDRGYWSGFHLELFFLDEKSGKVKRLRVRIKRWSLASKGLHGAKLATEAVHAGEIVAQEINFLPIVGDFFKIGADFADYRSGNEAAAVWADTIRSIMLSKGLEFRTVVHSELDDDDEFELRCRQCGASVDSSWKACSECGSELSLACIGCGADMEMDWVACPFCGYEACRVCRSCGEEMKDDWISCPSCGCDLAQR